MIPLGPRTFHLPLWPVYRDGLLVAAFVTFEAAVAYEDHLEAEADIEIGASWEPTPIGHDAADAVTVAAFAEHMLDDAALADAERTIDRAFGNLADFPHKADGKTKRGDRR